MTDIVQRLMAIHERARELGGDMMTFGPGDPLCVEAANEIVHLRGLLDEARHCFSALNTPRGLPERIESALSLQPVT